MMSVDSGFLLLVSTEGRNRLEYASNESERDVVIARSTSYRISPIFPVSPSCTRLPEMCPGSTVGFFTLTNPFALIGKLLDEGAPELHSRLWFGYGLSSLILFTDNPVQLEQLKDIVADGLRAFERWAIDQNGEIVTGDSWIAPPAFYDPGNFRLESAKVSSNADLKYLVNEIGHGLNAIVPLAAKYAPSYLKTLQRLAAEINDFIDELASLLESRITTRGDTPDDRELEQEQFNALTDHLVQINSVLAYAESQGFGGSSPILSNRSYIHGHSLLGVGSAVTALHAFLSCVHRAFNSTPVYSAVRSAFATTSHCEVFRHLDEVDLQKWSEQRARVDLVLDNLPPSPTPPKPHVLFFSGRLGFQEAPYSISAAVQSLPFADTVRWSLMTLSHEIMHAHVRELLEAVFAGNPTNPQAFDTIKTSYDRYCEFKRNLNQSPANLNESVRFALFNYCLFRQEMDFLAANGTTTHALVSLDELRRTLQLYYRDMNEIIVHLLDFQYFYNSDIDLYVQYLWESWSTVPSVLANPEHYLLRTLAVVTTTCKGSLQARFDSAVSFLSTKINDLMNRAPSNILLSRVSEMLASVSCKTTLNSKSLPNQYLAEFVKHCLTSSAINDVLMDDELNDVVKEEVHFQLRAGEFQQIQSPVALLLDRIRRSMTGDRMEVDLSIEFRSAWLLLACASPQSE